MAAEKLGPPAPPPPTPIYSSTVYLLSTGRIVAQLTHSGGTSCASSTRGEIDGLFDFTSQYVDITQTPPVIATRPTMPLAVDNATIASGGTAAATISGVPAGATVAVDDGDPQACTSATVTFTASDPGTYTLTFSAFPYLDNALTVTAT